MEHRKQRRRQYQTIREVMQLVDVLQLKCNRSPRLYAAQSFDHSAPYKKLISACNSIAVVFMQYDLLREALDLLKRGSAADVELYKQGSLLDRLWEGRVYTYNNLAYLFQRSESHRIGDLSAALKFVYDSQSLLLTLQKSGGQASNDLSISTNFITFLVLWRVKKYRESQTYIHLCLQSIKQLLTSKDKSRLNYGNKLNLWGILTMSAAAVRLKVAGDLSGAQHSLQECIAQLASHETAVKVLLEQFAAEMSHILESHTGSRVSTFESVLEERVESPKGPLPEIPSEYFRRQMRPNASVADSNRDWLISSEFDALFFITVLLPFISPKTPLIRQEELEAAQLKQRTRYDNESSRSSSRDNSYVKLMQSVRSKGNSSVTPPLRHTSATARSSRERAGFDTPSARLNARLDRVREESKDMEEDELNRTAPMRHRRQASSSEPERRFGSVPPALANKQVIYSPIVGLPKKRPVRHASRPKGSLIVSDLGPVIQFPRLPLSNRPRGSSQPRTLSRRERPPLRQTRPVAPRTRPKNLDSFVLLDLALRQESAEEPKEKGVKYVN